MADGKDKLYDGLLDIANGLIKVGNFLRTTVEACSVSEANGAAAPKSRRASTARLASQKRTREKSAAVVLATAKAIAPGTPGNDVKMTDPADEATPLAPAAKATSTEAPPAGNTIPSSKPGVAKAVDTGKTGGTGKAGKSTRKPKSAKQKMSVLAINPETPSRLASKAASAKKPATPNPPAAKSPAETKAMTPTSPSTKATAEKKPATPKSTSITTSPASKPKTAAKARTSVKAQALAADIARKETEAQKQAEAEAQKQIESQKRIDAEKDKEAEEDDEDDSDDESFMSASVSDEDSISESESEARNASELDSPRTPPGTVFKKVALAGNKRTRGEDDDHDDEGATKNGEKKASGANGKATKRKRLNADMVEKVGNAIVDIVKENPNWAGPQIAKHGTESLDVSENQFKVVLRRLVVDGVIAVAKGRKGYVVIDKADAKSSSPTMKNIGHKSPGRKTKALDTAV